MARAKGQKTVTVSLSDKLLAEIDAARKHRTRSEFAREAFAEKLERDGIVVADEILEPPSREGKGGQPTHQKPVDFKALARSRRKLGYALPPPASEMVAENTFEDDEENDGPGVTIVGPDEEIDPAHDEDARRA